MTPQIRLQSRAALDLRDHYTYLLRQEPKVSAQFADAIENSFQRLLESPMPGFSAEFDNPRLRDVHWWQVRGFPNHVIYYRPTTDGIEVLRVLHASRDAEPLL